MSRICPLFSGSKSNCTIISGSSGAVLVDVGCSYKQLLSALNNINADISHIKAVAITHEHSDHINGLKMLLKNNNIPVIASKQTLDTLINAAVIPSTADIILANEYEIEINDMIISRFPTSHDCVGSSGYSVFVDKDKKFSVCTDTGILTNEAKTALLGSSAVVIESNHDINMLRNGFYPPYLKMRILSEKGHLSNNACAEFLPQLLQSGTNRIILGHLSQNNNTPLLATTTAVNSLSVAGAKENFDYILYAAKPNNNEVLTL